MHERNVVHHLSLLSVFGFDSSAFVFSAGGSLLEKRSIMNETFLESNPSMFDQTQDAASACGFIPETGSAATGCRYGWRGRADRDASETMLRVSRRGWPEALILIRRKTFNPMLTFKSTHFDGKKPVGAELTSF